MGWVLNATPEVDAQSQYPTIIAICVVLSVLSSAVVLARLWVRWTAHGFASDDWVSGLSMIFAIIYSGLCIAQTRYGLGLPLALRPPEDKGQYMKINFAGRPFYQLGISFFKIALCISYLRLLRGTDRKTYRMVVWVTIVLVFIAHLACTFALLFACNPISGSWDPNVKAVCFPSGPSFKAYAAITIVTDIVVALLPLPVLIKLEVRLGKKIGLIAIFTLGLFTTLCSIFRYTQIDEIPKHGNSTMLVLWGTIEFNIGNMVSSLPFLAPVFMRKAKQYRSKHSGDQYDNYGTPSGRSRGLKSDHYRLKDMSGHGKDAAVFVSVTNKSRTGSEENILQGNSGITKSMTYTVRVDEETGKSSSNNSTVSRDVRI